MILEKYFPCSKYKMPVTSANAASGAVVGSPRRQYISIRPFNTFFWTYSVSSTFDGGDYVTTGTLANVTGATATTCPAGRVLRENGKRLYPGVNPGVDSVLVGVFDDKTFLNGFIDPNARVFQTQSTDFAPTLSDPVDGAGNGTRDLGNGVYTRGDVRAEGDLDISGAAAIGGNVTINGTTRVGATGSAYAHIKTGTVAVDPGSIAASTVTLVAVTVPYVFVGTESVVVNTPTNLSGSLAFAGAYCSTVSTVVLRIHNTSLTTAVDDTSKTWTYTLFGASTL